MTKIALARQIEYKKSVKDNKRLEDKDYAELIKQHVFLENLIK